MVSAASSLMEIEDKIKNLGGNICIIFRQFMNKSTNKKYTYWSEKEVSLLKELYPKMHVKDLVKIFPRRNKATIAVKALSLDLLSAKLWQPEENNILHKHFTEASKEKLLEFLPKRSWLAILAHGERLTLKRKTDKPKLKVNEDYFKKWSSSMVYILGFIFADGSIGKITHNGCSDRLSFGQNKKDIDILKKIKKELSAEQILSIGEKYVYFSIHSQIIVDDLKKLGVSYRKSFQKYPCKLPCIPKKYIRDFIRGIVDGDGSISFDKREYPTLSICGRKEVMAFIRNHFLFKFNVYSKIGQPKKNGRLSNVFYIAYRSNSAKTLINYLYVDTTLYLERKSRLAKRALSTDIKYRRNYTREENRIIRHTYHSLSKDKILSMLSNRKWSYIQSHAWQIGLTKNKRRKKKLCF